MSDATQRATRAAALAEVRARIASAGGDLDRIRVLAVTKGFGLDAVRAAAGLGLRAVGESYARELIDKAAAMDGTIEFHMIGRLQRNKVRSLAPWVSRFDSVDRESLAVEIARRAPGARVLVQVDAASNPDQGGVAVAEAPALVAHCQAQGLRVEGLMSIGVHGDAQRTRAVFDEVVELADRLGLDERSLGMSDDLEVAVAAGTTEVRVGTALFGARPPRFRAPEVG